MSLRGKTQGIHNTSPHHFTMDCQSISATCAQGCAWNKILVSSQEQGSLPIDCILPDKVI